jgi:hypothetical protein
VGPPGRNGAVWRSTSTLSAGRADLFAKVPVAISMCRCPSASSTPVGLYVDDCLADEIGRIIKNLVDSLDIRFVDVLAVLVESVRGDRHDQPTPFAGLQQRHPLLET